MKRFRALLAASALAVVGAATGLRADVVTDWNETLLQAIRVQGGPPCPASRWCTHLYVAMFDAANSVYGDYEPIIIKKNVTQTTSARAAIASAAHDILVSAYPAQQAAFDTQLTNSLALLPAGLARTRGVLLGQQVAAAVMAARVGDGSADNTPYTFGTNPGDYEIVDPDIFTAVASPNWGKVKPWVMNKSTQFRCGGPLGFKKMSKLLESAGYAAQFNEVKSLGRLTGSTRTSDQTDIAWFWANDVDGTSKPPGQLLQITDSVANDYSLDFYKKSRLFALVALAMGDSCIAAWDTKYRTWCDLWRPETAIRKADLDNNPSTTKDATWEPLAPWTPPFPAYVSGHATFGATHAAILRNYFRTDNIEMDIITDDPHYTGPSPRHYTSLTQIARENGRSRIYLGVHYQFDADGGFAVGTQVGNWVFDHAARPKCVADVNGDGFVDSNDLQDFSDAFFADDTDADFDKNGVLDYNDYFDYLDAYNGGCN